MSSVSDLMVLAYGIAKLEDELAEATAKKADRTEIEDVLELAREVYTTIRARLENDDTARGRRNRRSHYLQGT